MFPLIAAAIPLLGRLLSGAAKGQTAERTNANDFATNTDRNKLAQYGTQQNALLSALLAGGRDKMDAYGTQQSATTNATQGLQGATSHALDAQSAEGLQRAQLGLQAPSIRARQSVLGSLMKNLQPVHVQGPAGQAGHESTITGGLSASALDPTTREHGSQLMNAALMAQLNGSDVPPPTDFKSGIQDWKGSVLAPPEATDYTKGILAPPTLSSYQQPGKLETGLSWGGTIGNILGAILDLQKQGAKPVDPGMGAG